MVFTSFSTNKLFESYTFYQELLGLEAELIGDRFLHIYRETGGPIVVYQKTDHVPADFTVLNFQIQDIESIVNQLIEKGITFLSYDEPIKTDQKGISWDDQGSHLAWFKDPGGNILALIEN
ncbi:MAG: VOC family protein [Bacteroidota bacterium]